MSQGRTYVVRDSRTYATAITALQIKAGTMYPIKVMRAWCTQRSTATSAQAAIQISRKTAPGAVSSFTPIQYDPTDAASGAAGGAAATGVNATAEGTDGDVLLTEGFNIVSGWYWIPTPEEYIEVPATGIIALKFPAAPTSATYDVGMVYQEGG